MQQVVLLAVVILVLGQRDSAVAIDYVGGDNQLVVPSGPYKVGVLRKVIGMIRQHFIRQPDFQAGRTIGKYMYPEGKAAEPLSFTISTERNVLPLDPVKSLVMGLPVNLSFRAKGQLAIDICTDALADGIRFDFMCGDEVYGNCTGLREFFEGRGQGDVLRVPSNFHLTLASG